MQKHELLNELVDVVVKEGASDLHLSEGRPPVIRVSGFLIPLVKMEALTKADMEGFLATLLTDQNRKEFEEGKEANFSYSHAAGKRFRCNAFMQQGHVGLVLRTIPQTLPTIDTLGLPQILKGGARVLYISNEHPDVLERLLPSPADEQQVRAAMRLLREGKRMKVSSPAGTRLEIGLEGARVGGVWGFTEKPGTLSHWPGGLCLAFPKAGSVSGTLVMAPGDLNLTFKRYLETPVRFTIESDYVTAVEGQGVDADLTREYFAAWGDREAYAVSHVGWGMNPRARWDALALYDKRDVNGTEQRAFAGNFLYSTGANEVAGRHTLGHFDLPLRGCTIAVDDRVVVRDGTLVG